MAQKYIGIGLGVIAVVAIGGIFFYSNGDQGASKTASPSVQGATAQEISQDTYTLSEIQVHNNSQSCFTTINGKVYDLTDWIGQHPGGAMRILNICGKDGSGDFNNQHGADSRVQNQLSSFYIGELTP